MKERMTNKRFIEFNSTIGHRAFPVAASTLIWNILPVITIYCNLSPAAEDILVPTVIPGHHHLTLLTMLPWTL